MTCQRRNIKCVCNKSQHSEQLQLQYTTLHWSYTEWPMHKTAEPLYSVYRYCTKLETENS